MIKKFSELQKILDLSGIAIDSDDRSYITHYIQNDEQYKKKANKILNNHNIEIDLNNFTWDIPYPFVKSPKFTFIDLFAGIGGFRIAFQNLKGKCVYSSEIDKYCKMTYETNFGETPFGDITQVSTENIPSHDVLLAGFPCQAFSIAGKKKGFKDTRGTLFYEIARIIADKKPKAFFLENVKGLLNHDKGKTLEIILDVLRKDLNYYVPDPQIINSKNFNVPQNRERIFIVGFRDDLNISNFNYPDPKQTNVTLGSIKENKVVSSKYYLSTRYLKTLENHKARHKSKGNGFGYKILNDDEIANAIIVGGMGRERNLVKDERLKDFTPKTNIQGSINKKGIRRMTPREWARLQGFDDSFLIDAVSDTQLYKQFGNSVSVPAIYETGKNLLKKLDKNA